MTELPKHVREKIENAIADKVTQRVIELGPGVTHNGIAHIIDSETNFASRIVGIAIDYVMEGYDAAKNA